MSKKCVRYVGERFFLLDSGLTFSLRESDKNLKSYIAYFLLGIQDKIYATSRGQAQQNLDIEKFLQFPIALPPLSEQKRIAARLQKQLAAVEQARQAAETQLAEINLLSDAILREALTP